MMVRRSIVSLRISLFLFVFTHKAYSSNDIIPLIKRTVTRGSATVYGGLRNLAFNKPVYQSSIYGQRVASLAVDGSLSSDGKYYFAITNEEFRSYWVVSLGQTSLIEQIIIWNRGCCGARLHHLRVTVAGYDEKFTTRCGFFNGPGTNGQVVRIKFPRNTVGQAVKLQIESVSRSFLQLCEVRVIGRYILYKID